MEKLLTDLVAMRTISEDAAANEKALDYIEAYLAKRGMTGKRHVFKGHGALVASTRPDNLMHPKVMLTAHVDVMLGSDNLFTLRKEGDRFLGRGVYDMKSAVAAYLYAVDKLQDKLESYDFGIMITTDEEFGGRGGVNGTRDLIEEGYRTDVCILPDGGRNWQIEYLAKGYLRFELIAKGKTAHGSRPWQGESASYKLIDALHDLKDIFKDHGPETDTLNIAVLQGGKVLNQIPDHMVATIEIRIISEESLLKTKKILAELCVRHDVSANILLARGPMLNDVEHPLIQSFRQSVQTITGKESKPCISYAASDALYFNNLGIPCVVTYPIGGLHHSENEWISVDALHDFPNIILDYLEKTAKTADEPLAMPAEALTATV